MRPAFSFLRLLPFLAALMMAFSMGACKPKYPKCKKDKHCKVDAGEKCVDGNCQNCASDEDCKGKGPEGKDFVCAQFRCQDPAAVEGGAGGGGDIDAPCTQRTDCQLGLACKAGKCALCAEDIDCAPNTCNIATGRCSPEGQCQTDDDCPIDEICDGGVCIFSGDLGGGGGGPCGIDAVFFAFDSDKLTPKATEALAQLAECVQQGGQGIFLEAHADNVGTEEYNILLTERRGQSVKNYLTTLGVGADLLEVIAKGALEAQGQDESSRSKDRRVQFILQ